MSSKKQLTGCSWLHDGSEWFKYQTLTLPWLKMRSHSQLTNANAVYPRWRRDPSNVFNDAVDGLFQGCGRKNPRRIFFAPVFPYAGDNLGMECEKIGRWRLLNACNMSFHHRDIEENQRKRFVSCSHRMGKVISHWVTLRVCSPEMKDLARGGAIEK